MRMRIQFNRLETKWKEKIHLTSFYLISFTLAFQFDVFARVRVALALSFFSLFLISVSLNRLSFTRNPKKNAHRNAETNKQTNKNQQTK